MFRGEHQHRSHGQNIALAGALALVAGMVNTAGFLKEGFFTSHITGHAGQLSLAMAAPSDGALWSIAVRILAFFIGAMLACIAIEGSPWKNKPFVYGALLAVEASLLLTVMLGPIGGSFGGPVMFVAMGLQNGLVTRLSGAIVRTTHLTGVITDLGIEAGRWGLLLGSWLRARVRTSTQSASHELVPSAAKTLLLLTILLSFLVGGTVEAWLFTQVSVMALVAPVSLLTCGSTLAFWNGTQPLGAEAR